MTSRAREDRQVIRGERTTTVAIPPHEAFRLTAGLGRAATWGPGVESSE